MRWRGADKLGGRAPIILDAHHRNQRPCVANSQRLEPRGRILDAIAVKVQRAGKICDGPSLSGSMKLRFSRRSHAHKMMRGKWLILSREEPVCLLRVASEAPAINRGRATITIFGYAIEISGGLTKATCGRCVSPGYRICITLNPSLIAWTIGRATSSLLQRGKLGWG